MIIKLNEHRITGNIKLIPGYSVIDITISHSVGSLCHVDWGFTVFNKVCTQ